jgi:hypothetical protein
VRLSFNGREGLVLHCVGYTEGDTRRPVMHRASIVEMCVPYAGKGLAGSRFCNPMLAHAQGLECVCVPYAGWLC